MFDAAIGLFTTHGYSAVTLADIAAEVGLARNSLYRYFPDKAAILLRWYRTELPAQAASLLRPLAGDDAASERLLRWAEAQIDYARRPEHALIAAMAEAAPDLDADARAELAESHHRLLAPVTDALAATGLAGADLDAATEPCGAWSSPRPAAKLRGETTPPVAGSSQRCSARSLPERPPRSRHRGGRPRGRLLPSVGCPSHPPPVPMSGRGGSTEGPGSGWWTAGAEAWRSRWPTVACAPVPCCCRVAPHRPLRPARCGAHARAGRDVEAAPSPPPRSPPGWRTTSTTTTAGPPAGRPAETWRRCCSAAPSRWPARPWRVAPAPSTRCPRWAVPVLREQAAAEAALRPGSAPAPPARWCGAGPVARPRPRPTPPTPPTPPGTAATHPRPDAAGAGAHGGRPGGAGSSRRGAPRHRPPPPSGAVAQHRRRRPRAPSRPRSGPSASSGCCSTRPPPPTVPPA